MKDGGFVVFSNIVTDSSFSDDLFSGEGVMTDRKD